ncbi:putative addiction module antidote protein [Aliihoeflea aestuarii]|jgi:probable addiction module antidote protein|uniref:addiction module antidote protein n=1 Tax=Aliihoeflea aestuarii TaxID=453840 RepID=UPI002092E8B0|nr:addiction module antidote protein [Aliihoeflea aestuarii]MCO6390202.1 putative addiction module antidote protein [Aliihoeflea aestuarii]
MTVKIRPWDAASHLDSKEMILAYLEAALEDGDPALIAAAIGDVARARGMSEVAATAGMSRESLYKSLSTDGNPAFSTILKVLRALDLELTVKPHEHAA